jgi:uncharacterized membrane protein YbaN (DUF454 family)
VLWQAYRRGIFYRGVQLNKNFKKAYSRMTQQEKDYYRKIRRKFEDERKIASAVKWAIYVILVGAGVCWWWCYYNRGTVL